MWEPIFDGETWCVVWEDSAGVPMVNHFSDEAAARSVCAAVGRLLAHRPDWLVHVEKVLRRGVNAAALVAAVEQLLPADPHVVEVNP